MKLGIIFGSKSMEHDVSIVSASSIIKNLDKDKYKIYPIYLDNQENNWFKVNGDVKKMEDLTLGSIPKNITPIKNIIKYLKKLDVVFPVLHGKYGEDGTVQGMLELIGVPYVGCGIMTSSICLDKLYTKILLKNHLNVVDDISIFIENGIMYKWNNGLKEEKLDYKKIDSLITSSFDYPVFIKPSRAGSSVGVKKANNKKELIDGINIAKEYDNEILIEKCINGRELECAILNGKATAIGEVIAADTFYSYEAKYENSESKTIIPVDISKELENKIKKMAENAFSIINGKGLARIDFFLEQDTNTLYINEINTLPGFTKISMYPKLVAETGINYDELLDILIMGAKKSGE